MGRLKVLLLCLFCTFVMPILSLAMMAQASFGSSERALSMAIAIDECSNSLFGGDPKVTISERTGNGMIEGLRWALIAAPMIDFFFGAGHCRAHATKTVI